MTIGENIKKRCNEIGINAKDLAGLSQIPPTTLSGIINDKNLPRADNIKKLSIALGISSDKLLFDEDEKDDLSILIRELNTLTQEKKDYAKKVIRAILIQTKHEELSA